MSREAHAEPVSGPGVDHGAASPTIPSKSILVVGLPRSGTTWIGKIFDSHPRTLYLHEPDSAVPMNGIPLIAESIAPGMDRIKILATLARTTNVRLARVTGALPHFPKTYRTTVRDWSHRWLAVGAKVCSRVLGEFNVPDLFIESPRNPVRLVWKSVESIGRTGLLARLMPDWRIIHIARHPCGWIDSQKRGHRENRFSSDDRKDWWRFDLLQATSPARRRGLSEASFRTMSDLERDAWSWVLWNEIAAEATEGLTNVMTILYEDVCSSPVDQSRRIFSFAGLDWHPQSEAFVTRSVSTHRENYYSIYRDPLAAANKWRRSISPEELRVVESIMRQSKLGRMFLKAKS
jgi:hypothetical protein